MVAWAASAEAVSVIEEAPLEGCVWCWACGIEGLWDRLEGECDPLAAADAQGDEAAPQAVTPHRMDEAGGEHGPGRADRMAMRDGAALDIDDVLGETELARHHDRDRRERLVDLDPLDFGGAPAGALERLLDGRNGSEPEHPGLDRRDAPGDETRHRDDAARRRPLLLHQHRRRRPAVQSWRVAGGDGAAVAEGGLQCRQRLERRAGPWVLVGLEGSRTLAAAQLDGNDLVLEPARRLRRAEQLLRAQRPPVLLLAADLELADEVLRVPA